MATLPTLPSDRQLVGAVRSGSDAAWRELMGRHANPVRAMLRSRRERKTLERALARLRDNIEHEDDTLEGDPAVRAFRPRALAELSGGTYGPTPHVDTNGADQGDVQGFDFPDDELLALAFARLPEPWQTVLWHGHVEQLTAAEISPLVGRTTNDVAELINTAERGLVDAFLLEYIAVGPLPDGCERVVSMLGGHVRGTLPPNDQRILDRHFAGEAPDTEATPPPNVTDDAPASGSFAPPVARTHSVDDSRRLVRVIGSLDTFLPPAIAPGVTGVSVEEHRRMLGTSNRSFGSATLLANRSNRFRRVAMLGAAVAVVAVLVGAALLIRQPFDNDDMVVTSGGNDVDTSVAPDPATTVVGDDADPTTTMVDELAPTTTVLDLRPQPTGPSSEIELVAVDGTRPLGFAQGAEDLAIAVSAPAPVFAGGTGTLDISVTNSGAEAADASIEVRLPSGIRFDALAGGPVVCFDPSDDSPFCNVAVEAGASLDFSLRFGLESSTVGRLVVDGDLVTDPLEAAIVATGDLVHSSVGRGDVVMIGNSLMTCDDGAAAELGISCDAVRNGTGELVNRWDVPMEFIGPAPQFGIENSSSAVLSLPDNSSIVEAHLYWSGDLQERQQSIPDDGSNAVVTLRTPSGEVAQVSAGKLSLGDVDATQYLGSADVTDIVTDGGAGSYLIGNVQSVEVQGSYAAWSMIVVYDNDDEPRRHRVVTRPFEWIAPEPRFEYEVDLPVPVVQGGAAHLDVLAFEGERGFAPESLTVAGEIVGGESAFDSTIAGDRDPAYDNNLGADIDAYDLVIDTADGTLPIRATSEKDGIRIAVLALTVDLAS